MKKEYSYQEHTIPKKSRGVRKIVAPNYNLLTYQQRMLSRLEAEYHSKAIKAGVDRIAHGFLTGRNCVTAAEPHMGYNSTVTMDIGDFFDSVKREMFELDPKTSWIAKDDLLFHKDGYAAQGLSTSPILANIASIGMLDDIQTELDKSFGANGYAFTIYCDDMSISTYSTDVKILTKLIIKMVERVAKTHDFEINPHKTRIRYAKYGYRRMLGISVGKRGMKVSRKVLRKIRAARYQSQRLRGEQQEHAARSLGGLILWSKMYRPNNPQ